MYNLTRCFMTATAILALLAAFVNAAPERRRLRHGLHLQPSDISMNSPIHEVFEFAESVVDDAIGHIVRDAVSQADSVNAAPGVDTTDSKQQVQQRLLQPSDKFFPIPQVHEIFKLLESVVDDTVGHMVREAVSLADHVKAKVETCVPIVEKKIQIAKDAVKDTAEKVIIDAMVNCVKGLATQDPFGLWKCLTIAPNAGEVLKNVLKSAEEVKEDVEDCIDVLLSVPSPRIPNNV